MRAIPSLLLAGFLSFLIAAAAPGQTPGGSLQLTQKQAIPVTKLRGYGTLAGSLWTASGSNASILKIQCEDEGKAKLVLAKYLSDFGLLPGVKTITVKTRHGSWTGREAAGQGGIAALRSGQDVFLLAAAKVGDLETLANENLPAGLKIDATEPEVHVPMYLDRWDKYGFRFYYQPFVKPTGTNGRPVADYDQNKDFEFAQKSGHSGLVMWENPNGEDTAEGIMDTPTWSWVLDAAGKRGLPVGVNFGMSGLCWVFNRYRDQQLQGDPQFIGGWYYVLPSGPMLLSWNAAKTETMALGELQQTVRRYRDNDNVTSWMEPHEEISHESDTLVDYGPQADIGYRDFLRGKYGSVAAVARRWGTPLESWRDIHVPEMASFLGWNKEAIDLTGKWRISYTAPYDATSAAPDLDDSKWPAMTAPGDASVIYMPRRAAVFRRHIQVNPAWLTAHKHVWLYTWDLNDNRGLGNAGWHIAPGSYYHVYVNGQDVTEKPEVRDTMHRSMVEVSAALKPGDNQITELLPWGLFLYRVYLSPSAPKQYPDLGPALNARWADYSDWTSWCRAQAVRRGVRMIRQIDPNRPITLASPDAYLGDIKAIAQDYGAVFHNTGYMAGFWADRHCLAMANLGLADDVEPGSGAVNLPDFKRFLGRWSTEGIQGVDYFQHIGDILWKPAIRDYFTQTQNLWHLIGKYHVPKAQVAILNSDRINRLIGFPWHADRTVVPVNDYFRVWVSAWLRAEYPVESIVENDFQRGNAKGYKVIIDTNTSIMDPPLIAQIEKWVRAGGIFVTFGETGRHTSTEMDAWPISKLTGYAVVDANVSHHPIDLVAGQTVFNPDDWPHSFANGLALKKMAPECRDLMKWGDGTTAVGMRPLGKGWMIDLGASLDGPRVLTALLKWAGLDTIPGTVADKRILMRRFVSNNGLYDVWVLWNQSAWPLSADLDFRDGLKPAAAVDVNSGSAVPVETGTNGAALAGMQFEPLQTRAFLTPRNQIASAPARWFNLQRGWWQGTMDPGKPRPPFQPRISLPIQTGWAFKAMEPVPHGAQPPDASALASPALDDSSWPRQDLGVLNAVNHPGVKHAIFRRKFSLPKKWQGGELVLWAEFGPGNGRVYLDGKLQRTGIEKGGDLSELLKSGGDHELAMEVWGDQAVFGPMGNAWIAWRPKPVFHQNLAGQWDISTDGLTYSPGTLPGEWHGSFARQTVMIPAERKGLNAVVRVTTSRNAVPFASVIVNGHEVTHIYRNIELQMNLNVTPYLKFGEKNEIVLAGRPGDGHIVEVALDYYNKDQYP